MDRKSVEAAQTVQVMTDEHFSGGFYSPEVRAKYDLIKDLPEAEKCALYVAAFGSAYALASSLTQHPRYDDTEDAIDLTAEGLGVIGISVSENEGSPRVQQPPYKSVDVTVVAFDPSPEKYAGRDDDHTSRLPQHPPAWEDELHLNVDHTITGTALERLDADLLTVLDYIETLTFVKDVLATADAAPSAESQKVYDSLHESMPERLGESAYYFLGNGIRASIRHNSITDEHGAPELSLDLFDDESLTFVVLDVYPEKATVVSSSSENPDIEKSVPTSTLQEVADAIAKLPPVVGTSTVDWLVSQMTSLSHEPAESVDTYSIRRLIAALVPPTSDESPHPNPA